MSRGAAMDRLGLICPPAHTSGVDAAAGRMRHLSRSDKCFIRFSGVLPAGGADDFGVRALERALEASLARSAALRHSQDGPAREWLSCRTAASAATERPHPPDRHATPAGPTQLLATTRPPVRQFVAHAAKLIMKEDHHDSRD